MMAASCFLASFSKSDTFLSRSLTFISSLALFRVPSISLSLFRSTVSSCPVESERTQEETDASSKNHHITPRAPPLAFLINEAQQLPLGKGGLQMGLADRSCRARAQTMQTKYKCGLNSARTRQSIERILGWIWSLRKQFL